MSLFFNFSELSGIIISMKYLFAIIAMVALVVFAASTVRAAALYSLSDEVTRHAPGIPSDHTIKFKSPLPLDATGQNITVTFPVGFTLTALTSADVALSTGPATGLETSFVVAGAPTNSDWGFSLSGQSVILTHPLLAGTDIAAGDFIVIQIGTNAGGVNQIINRVALGNAVINIATSNGASGALAIPVANDSIGTGGDSGAIAPVTLLPPTAVTVNSMTLTWTQSADPDFYRYQLFYSTTPGVTDLNTLAVTSTSVTGTSYVMVGLNPNTQYYFAVQVEANSFLTALSNEVGGKTSSGATPLPPVPLPAPIITVDTCPIFQNPYLTRGTRAPDVQVFINGDNNNFVYPNTTTWQKILSYLLGPNLLTIYGIYPSNQVSITDTYTINRCKIGDVNCNGQVNDFDLAGLAWHWTQNWCPADFNKDLTVNDFDLAGLASHWGL